MPWVRFRLVLTCAVLCSARAQAAPAPIVFDFEDGLQGWELQGSAQRVQTQILGGEWAIFGDGRRFERPGQTAIRMEADLTGIASISVEQFFLDGREDGLILFVAGECSEGGVPSCIGLDVGPFVILEPGNPSLMTVDVRSIGENLGISIIWFGTRTAPSPTALVAFIDNITFHPVPEPGTLGLLAGSLVALVIARRRIV